MCRTDKVIPFYQRFPFQFLYRKVIGIVFIGNAGLAVDMLQKVAEVLFLQPAHLEPASDFILQKFLHLHKAVDFIVAHGDKVTHQLVVDFIEEVSKGHGQGFPCAFQTDFFLVHQQLKAKKKTVINLIFTNHIH